MRMSKLPRWDVERGTDPLKTVHERTQRTSEELFEKIMELGDEDEKGVIRSYYAAAWEANNLLRLLGLKVAKLSPSAIET